MRFPDINELKRSAQESLSKARWGAGVEGENKLLELLEIPPARLRDKHDKLAQILAYDVVASVLYPEEIAGRLLQLEVIARLVGRRHINPCFIFDLPGVDIPKSLCQWVNSGGGALSRFVDSYQVGGILKGKLRLIENVIREGKLPFDPNNLLRAYIWPDKWGGDVVDRRREVMAKKWQALVEYPQFPLDSDQLLTTDNIDWSRGGGNQNFFLGIGFWGDGIYVPHSQALDPQLKFFRYRDYDYYMGLKLLIPLARALDRDKKPNWLAVDADGQLCEASIFNGSENVLGYEGVVYNNNSYSSSVVCISNVLKEGGPPSLLRLRKGNLLAPFNFSPILSQEAKDGLHHLLHPLDGEVQALAINDWWDDTLHGLYTNRMDI